MNERELMATSMIADLNDAIGPRRDLWDALTLIIQTMQEKATADVLTSDPADQPTRLARQQGYVMALRDVLTLPADMVRRVQVAMRATK